MAYHMLVMREACDERPSVQVEKRCRATSYRFGAGWDCQGLPVELEVEKQMGVKNKRELLQRVSEERFIEECKKTIMKYHKQWVELDSRLGVFIDQAKAYWTFHDAYIEKEWQILKRAWDQGLLEEGHYVVAYCPGCQTSLSNAEIGFEDSYPNG